MITAVKVVVTEATATEGSTPEAVDTRQEVVPAGGGTDPTEDSSHLEITEVRVDVSTLIQYSMVYF